MLRINAESIEEEEVRAQAFLNVLNVELNHKRTILTEAEWNFVTNITDANQAIKDALAAENAKYIKVCIRLVPNILCVIISFYYFHDIAQFHFDQIFVIDNLVSLLPHYIAIVRKDVGRDIKRHQSKSIYWLSFVEKKNVVRKFKNTINRIQTN